MSGAEQPAPTLLFCIGAQKAGTTWLYKMLQGHPECAVREPKEAHYFDVRRFGPGDEHAAAISDRVIASARDLAGATRGPALRNAIKRLRARLDYMDIFAAPPGDSSRYYRWLTAARGDRRLVADITPAYALLDRTDFAEMAALPASRFLFILRDPVDRLWSALRMGEGTDIPDDGLFAQRCRERARRFRSDRNERRWRMCNYGATITELEAAVPAERIRYVFFEELFAPATHAALSEFLGITSLPWDVSVRANSGRPARLPDRLAAHLYGELRPVYEFCAARFGASLPGRWRARMAAAGDPECRERPA